MADLTLDTCVPKKTRPTSNKVSPAYVNKRKTENKLLVILESCSNKKADSSTQQLLLPLMEEVKGIKKKIEIPPGTSPSNSQCEVCGSVAHELADYPKKHPNIRRPRIANKQSTEPTEKYSKESGPKVVFRDDSSGDTKGYGLVNCNGITFTRVAYVNGLKHNLISISQLCDANFKVLFTKTQGTILTKMMKLSSFLLEEEMSMSLICHLSIKKAMPISLPRPLQVKIENLNEVRVKELRSDNGTEFRNYKLEEFYDEKGISQNFSSHCTPEQNGVPERRNKTLIEAAKTISIIVKRHRKTAYNVFRGRSPDISYFHVFGCPVHIHNHRDHLGKFNEKADDGFFLGYSLVAKAFNYFPYKPIYEIITLTDSLIPQDIVSLEDPPWFTETDDHPALNELDQPESVDILEYHIKLVNIIGEPLTSIRTRSRVRDSEATSAHECLYVNFLSEMEPKKLIKDLEEERYQVNLKESYLAVVKRIFRYLKGTLNLGLWYPKGSGFDLKVYSDSNYAGCNLDRKSTSGAKAEYVAAAGCLPLPFLTIQYYTLGQNILTSGITSSKTNILKWDIKLHCVPIDLQLADIFTKPLVDPSFTRVVVELDKTAKTITFSLSSFEKPMTFTQDEFISAIGLPICRNVIPLPLKETVRTGMATLGLIDKDKPSLSSTVLVNSFTVLTVLINGYLGYLIVFELILFRGFYLCYHVPRGCPVYSLRYLITSPGTSVNVQSESKAI
ncbi:retrovirus-related pol polyprotein from transposon TNT 1-94 [Tanacetum coccineum]